MAPSIIFQFDLFSCWKHSFKNVKVQIRVLSVFSLLTFLSTRWCSRLFLFNSIHESYVILVFFIHFLKRSFIKLFIFFRKINDFFHRFPPRCRLSRKSSWKISKSLINVATIYFPKSYPPTQIRVHAAEMCISWNDKE